MNKINSVELVVKLQSGRVVGQGHFTTDTNEDLEKIREQLIERIEEQYQSKIEFVILEIKSNNITKLQRAEIVKFRNEFVDIYEC